MGKKKKNDIVGKIPKGVWLLISLAVALILWTLLSFGKSTGRVFPNVIVVAQSIGTMIERGLLFKDIGSSLISVIAGFAIGFVTSIPVAFLMAWYRPVRYIVEPWIQFIRNIPPLAYVPLVVIGVGVGRTPQIIVIWLATFLIMTVTVFQGVINVDETLIKAARVLGAGDVALFIRVIFPATTPFIITAVRLGISTALTTLIAAESTGAMAIGSSLISVIAGFAIGFVTSIPVAFLMAWYRPVRYIVEPWIQFIRNIPPLAYVPLVVIGVGVGRTPQIIVIWLATFLIMTVTVFQGVINVDETLIKAARVLGAGDVALFIRVIFPATTPFIITAVRLGISTALTTLIAAESTGAMAGLGMRIKALANNYETKPMLLYIIIIGIIGMTAEKILKVVERKLTGWQEKREI